MNPAKLNILRFLFAFSDFILLNVCLFAAFHFAKNGGFYLSQQSLIPVLISVWLTWILSTSIFRLYSLYTVYKIQDIAKATWRSLVLPLALFPWTILLTCHAGGLSHFILIYYFITAAGFLSSRMLCYALFPLLNLNFANRKANILAIASVGGHWIELLRIMPLFKEKDVTFISNKESLKGTVDGYEFHTVPDANRNDILKLIKCVLNMAGHVLVIRPQVIITTGAAPGLLGILIGRILGIKTIWIDSVANVDKLSLSGKIAKILADRVYTQWEHLSNQKVVFSGNIL